jgi:chaperone modulatory protein CbpM
MNKQLLSLLMGEVLEEDVELTLTELCMTCQVPEERVYELVDEGIVEPLGRDPANWRFQGVSVYRVRCALHLERDLGVNVAGAALAIELLEELNAMRERLQRFSD